MVQQPRTPYLCAKPGWFLCMFSDCLLRVLRAVLGLNMQSAVHSALVLGVYAFGTLRCMSFSLDIIVSLFLNLNTRAQNQCL